jgi:hypothetical protein
MSSTTTGRSGASSVRSSNDEMQIYADEDRATGWLFFAGSILGLAGIMRIIDAIWAFTYKGALPDGLKNGVLGDDLKTYAWTWLIVGTILIIASFFVIARSQIARWVGLFAAAIGGISAIAWMPYYPVWSLVYIGMAVTVFYALTVYGGRATAYTDR